MGYDFLKDVVILMQSIFSLEKSTRNKWAETPTMKEKDFVIYRKGLVLPVIKKITKLINKNKKSFEVDPNIHDGMKYYINNIEGLTNYLECAHLTPSNSVSLSLIK
jgi:hypothetical protein